MRVKMIDELGPEVSTLRRPRALDLPLTGDDQFSPAQLQRPLRVLFLVSQPQSSPAISVHANLMRFLQRPRVQVHVVYNRLADSDPYRLAGQSVRDTLPHLPDILLRPTDFGPGGAGSRRALAGAAARAAIPLLRDNAGLIRYIQRHEIDVIHCEEGTRNGFYAMLLSRLTRARSVLHFHARYGDWMSPISQRAVQRADAVIAVSSWTGRLIRDAGVPAHRIFPVLNGIDPSLWDPETDGSAVRAEFGLAPEDPLVVSVAQLAEYKRQPVLIDAFARVAARHPRARLLIVGAEQAPPTGPGARTRAQQLQEQVDAAGLTDRVALTGRRTDVPRILAAADIAALPSVDDPCPLAQIEAMAMATAVVGVRAGGAPEFIEHGGTGLLGAADDPGELAENLLALIESPARRRELGAGGRRHVERHLNAQRMADEVEAVYRAIR